jgi:hypothetical protein
MFLMKAKNEFGLAFVCSREKPDKLNLSGLRPAQ